MADRSRYFSEIMSTAADQQPTEEDDDEKSQIYKEPMRRNLLDVFEKAVEINDERMNVFLRIRPFSPLELENSENQVCFFP
jgi:hypothetical protein